MNAADPTADAPRLRLEGVSKSFFGVQVLHDVGLEAHAGEVLGLVGENGSGKSTTMNIVSGVLPRDAGHVFLDGAAYQPSSRREADAAGVAFIQQELNVFANLSVAENLFLCRSPRAIPALPFISRSRRRTRALELLKAVDLQVDPDAPASRLSIGEQQLLEIAAALASDAKVMIFDEPTTSLTRKEAERLFEIIARLKQRGVAIIYISHTLEDVLRLSDRLVVMRDGRVVLRSPRAGLTIDQLVVAMVGRTIEALYPERKPRTGPSAPVLDVTDVGEPGLLNAISFQVGSGEIVGISGLMGSGRTELARVLFGLDPHRRGTIRMGGRELPPGSLGARLDAGMAFLTEDRRHEGLMMDATVAQNLELAVLPNFSSGPDRRVTEEPLAKALTEMAARLTLKGGASRTAAARTLSGGNQQKILLGRWLLRNPALFILDEPTRGVDVGAKAEIYRALSQMAESGMAILVVSSEIEELIGLCDRILTMRLGQIQAEFDRERFDRTALLRAAFGQGEAP